MRLDGLGLLGGGAVALAAARMVGEGLGAHRPAGFATPGGCSRRVGRVSFCAEYRSAGLRAVGGFSSIQLYGLVIQSSVLRPMKLRFGPKSGSGSRALSLPLQCNHMWSEYMPERE